MTFPTPKVEIAFNSGYSTPAASRTWTDVTEWWEAPDGCSISRGRSDELSQVSPSTMTLTFDNRDGRFTPGRASSPYYPNVKVGRPIRVTVTPDDGTPSVRFVGYIDEWPVAWDGTDAYSSVTVQATSRTARLGQNAGLRSIIEETVLSLGPDAYFALGEPEGATTARDSSGNNRDPLLRAGSGAAVAFGTGTGPTTDALPAATFAGGGHLAPSSTPGVVKGVFTLCMAIASTTPGGYLWGMHLPRKFSILALNGGSNQVRINSAGKVEIIADLVNPSLDDSAAGVTTVTDGQVHTIVVVRATVTGRATLYVDGVNQGISPTWALDPASLTIGNARDQDGGFLTTYSGTMAHLALFDRELTASEAAAYHAACKTGYTGEVPGTRLARYATYSRLPAAETSFATGSTPIAHIDTTGQGVVEAMQAVADTDGGILFDARDGTLTYQSRDVRYQAAAALTLLADSQEIEADYAPRLDRSALVNDVTASNGAGTVSARALASASRDEYGAYAEALTLATDSDAALSDAAWWRVNTRAEPGVRVPSLSVNLLNLDTARQQALLGLDISSRIVVTGLPAQASGTSADYFVEGYTETITDATHTFTLNVSDGSPWLTTWVLDSPTRSQLGTTTRLGY